MVDASLFGLVSRAGNASLGELRARSSVDAADLATQLGTLLRDGSIALTAKADSQSQSRLFGSDSSFSEAGSLIQNLTGSGLDLLLRGRADVLDQAIQTALSEDKLATSIMVSPTSKGFRRRL